MPAPARIVHPPDWPHAAAVRRVWTEPNADVLVVDVALRLPTAAEAHANPGTSIKVVRLRRHSLICRCDRDRHVWAPLGHTPRRCDFGACPRCDRWYMPSVSAAEVAGFDRDLLRAGETVAWHELSNASIMGIARFESWRARGWRIDPTVAARFFMRSARTDLGFALAEAAYRGLLPTPDELLAAWDLALAHGWAKTDDDQRLTLVDVWALFVPRLRSLFTCGTDEDALACRP